MDPAGFDRLAQHVGRQHTPGRSRRQVLVGALVALGWIPGASVATDDGVLAKGKRKGRPKPDRNSPPSCALRPYRGSNINLDLAMLKLSDARPDAHLVDLDFFPALDVINQCA